LTACAASVPDVPILRDENKDGDGDCTDGSDERIYYLTDANMNVVALTDDSAAAVLERYSYDPYGNVTVLDADFSADADGASDYDNPVLYCGYWRDRETGLYHVRYRYYHDRLGRWLTRDLLGSAQHNSLYEYVGSEPVRYLDAWGRDRYVVNTWPIPGLGPHNVIVAPGFDEEGNPTTQWYQYEMMPRRMWSIDQHGNMVRELSGLDNLLTVLNLPLCILWKGQAQVVRIQVDGPPQEYAECIPSTPEQDLLLWNKIDDLLTVGTDIGYNILFYNCRDWTDDYKDYGIPHSAAQSGCPDVPAEGCPPVRGTSP